MHAQAQELAERGNQKLLLYVNEQPDVLGEALCTMLAHEAGAWGMWYAWSAAEALDLLATGHFTAVVVPARSPGFDGLQLLDEVMRRAPRVLRIIRSRFSEQDTTLRCVGGHHQLLVEPCHPKALINALEQMSSIQPWLPNDAVRDLLTNMRRLPSPPEIYFQIVAELESDEPELERVADLVARDPALTAKLLQLANSAVLGLQLRVRHPAEAIAFLGLETTQALVVLAHTFSFFEELLHAKFCLDSLQHHSLTTGRFAKTIAQAQTAGRETTGEAYTAGLLHDIGKLLLAANLPLEFRLALDLAKERELPLWQAEYDIVGATHAELGAGLLGLWGLPAPIVEAVVGHHWPEQFAQPGFSPLTAVHVANALDHETRVSNAESAAQQGVNVEYLRLTGFESCLESWRRKCVARAA